MNGRDCQLIEPLECEFAFRWYDDDQLVGKQVTPVGAKVLAGKIVGPRFIRRQKQIGASTLRYLASQFGGRTEVRFDDGAR
jgi:hypothetical protein